MNRYETTISLTVSVRAKNEAAAREAFQRAEDKLSALKGLRPVSVTYVESSDELDCMEVAAMREP